MSRQAAISASKSFDVRGNVLWDTKAAKLKFVVENLTEETPEEN